MKNSWSYILRAGLFAVLLQVHVADPLPALKQSVGHLCRASSDELDTPLAEELKQWATQ